MQGNLYPTVRVARCPSYHPCEICTGCTQYNPHDAACAVCESRKPPEWICIHTDRQQWTKTELDRRFREPMFHPDKKPSELSIPVAYDNPFYQQIVELQERKKAPVKETVKR